MQLPNRRFLPGRVWASVQPPPSKIDQNRALALSGSFRESKFPPSKPRSVRFYPDSDDGVERKGTALR